jgi:hypothetical protein
MQPKAATFAKWADLGDAIDASIAGLVPCRTGFRGKTMKPLLLAAFACVLAFTPLAAQEEVKPIDPMLVPTLLAYLKLCPTEAWMEKLTHEAVAIEASEKKISPEEVRRIGNVNAQGMIDFMKQSDRDGYCAKARPALMKIYDDSRPKPSFAQRILGNSANHFIDSAIFGLGGMVIGALLGFGISLVTPFNPLKTRWWLLGWLIAGLVIRSALIRLLTAS